MADLGYKHSARQAEAMDNLKKARSKASAEHDNKVAKIERHHRQEEWQELKEELQETIDQRILRPFEKLTGALSVTHSRFSPPLLSLFVRL